MILDEIKRLKGLKYMRGVILGTTGLGKGLDDPELLPVFKALQDEKLPIFLHPHYGLPSSVVSSFLFPLWLALCWDFVGFWNGKLEADMI